MAAAGIFLGGLCLSGVLFIYARAWERQSIHTELDLRARQRVEVAQSKVLRSLEVLHGAAAFFETRGDVSRQEFASFVRTALQRQPELRALAWTPYLHRDQRAVYESRAVADGLKNFHITAREPSGRTVVSAEADEYYPVYYIEPADRNQSAMGFSVRESLVR